MKKFTLLMLMTITIGMLSACSVKEKETMNENGVTPTQGVTPEPTKAAQTEEIDYIGKKLIALTFDDGPNTDTTPLVLDKLEKYGVVASFFLIGQNVNAATKPILERQLSLGCELENHSWSHPSMDKITVEEIKKQIEDTNNIIYEMVEVTPKFFRPPYIATSEEMYNNIDIPFVCGVGCNDWEATVTKDQRVETLLTTVKDGDIILLHDMSGNQNTVDALDEIIPSLLEEGYAFVTVSKLFELKGVEPNVENVIWTNTNQ